MSDCIVLFRAYVFLMYKARENLGKRMRAVVFESVERARARACGRPSSSSSSSSAQLRLLQITRTVCRRDDASSKHLGRGRCHLEKKKSSIAYLGNPNFSWGKEQEDKTFFWMFMHRMSHVCNARILANRRLGDLIYECVLQGLLSNGNHSVGRSAVLCIVYPT